MTNRKHIVYAEDVVYKLMQYPYSSIPKGEIRKLVEAVAAEQEVNINTDRVCSYCDDEGDIYD